MTTSRTVVACFLQHESEILLLRRSAAAPTDPGKWSTVTAEVTDQSPRETADREIVEQTASTHPVHIRTGDAVSVANERGSEGRLEVIPFLFEVDSREITHTSVHETAEWVVPPTILHRDTVPWLWRCYRRIGPSPATIRSDTAHGSAYVSLKALESLRDTTGEAVALGGSFAEVRETAIRLVSARPAMTVVQNRINRVMAGAQSLEDIQSAVTDAINRAYRVDAQAAANGVDLVRDKTVLTLSRSGTVTKVLTDASVSVFIAESGPTNEGIMVAEELATKTVDVTLLPDAGVPHVVSTTPIDCILVGADAVLATGGVVNKIGTRTAALAGDFEHIPLYVITATDKISTGTTPQFESAPPSELYDGPSEITAINPRFDYTPPALISGIITEKGVLPPTEIASIAKEHESYTTWHENS